MQTTPTISESSLLQLKILDAEDDLRRLVRAINAGRVSRGRPELTPRDVCVIAAARNGDVKKLLSEQSGRRHGG